MTVAADYVIVGAGLTGSTIARLLADANREVLLIERRPHVGGNLHDWRHQSGIAVHTYGPHYFRTSSDRIWAFVRRFAAFRPYEAIVRCFVAGRCEPWPLTRATVERLYGATASTAPVARVSNFEERLLNMIPQLAYEQFIRGYTKKQWACDPRQLSMQLAARIELREGDDPRLKRSRYQGLPAEGYGSFMRSLVAGIPLFSEVDYLCARDQLRARVKLIFTGPIDTFFDHRFGRLSWRGQRREHVHLPGALRLPSVQLNFPSESEPAIRVIEWAHMMPAHEPYDGTLLTYETPYTPTDPDAFEYPVPDSANAALFERYRSLAEERDDVIICGRLGEYRYLDMDQAIARALRIGAKLLREPGSARITSCQKVVRRQRKNLEIEHHTEMEDVFEVVHRHKADMGRVPAIPDLPQTSDSGPNAAAYRREGCERREHVRHQRAGSDQRHSAAQHVDQLGQFIETGASQPAPRRRDPRIVIRLDEGAVVRRNLRCAPTHGAELEQREDFSVEADASLTEEHGTGGVYDHGHAANDEGGQQDDQQNTCADDIEQPLRQPTRALAPRVGIS
jgi:UDP-galactopyranose mutase